MYAVFQEENRKKKDATRNGVLTTVLHDSKRNGTYRNNKIKRNSSCPCESGKKYKNCCLKSERTVDIFKKFNF
ncbi:MAG: hypothetical protein CL760_08950 [Chloroflexi bacterium]|nr:hypothetical protein [Chloroflexota bacterium]